MKGWLLWQRTPCRHFPKCGFCPLAGGSEGLHPWQSLETEAFIWVQASGSCIVLKREAEAVSLFLGSAGGDGWPSAQHHRSSGSHPPRGNRGILYPAHFRSGINQRLGWEQVSRLALPAQVLLNAAGVHTLLGSTPRSQGVTARVFLSRVCYNDSPLNTCESAHLL